MGAEHFEAECFGFIVRDESQLRVKRAMQGKPRGGAGCGVG
jgi:hypothetical protein